MRLLYTKEGQYPGQADPFILKSNGRYYIYVTGHDAIYAYHSDQLLEGWEYYGPVLTAPGRRAFWAPSVIELDGKFYMYNSVEGADVTPDPGGHDGCMHVSVADHPLGPFRLYDLTGIDLAYDIMQRTLDETGEKPAGYDVIKEYYDKGWYGKKVGRGFYEYEKK